MEKEIKFINKAKIIHNNKYDYSKIIYNGIKSKVKIICSEHGEFEQTPHHHVTRKQGCPKCRYINISKKTRGSLQKFISDAKLVHSDKYDYSLVEYVNRKTKVKIICPKHGVFEQEPNNHINGQECGKCHGLYKTNDDFIIEAKTIHSEKYDYSLIKYIDSKTKVNIICPQHGEFKQLPYAHIYGQGCPKCIGLNKTTDEFIKEAKEVHGDKYDYSLVDYFDSREKIKIICKNHGEFIQSPNMHLRNNGCPICCESKGEKLVRVFLLENKINFIQQHKFNDCKNILPLPFDFYLPDYNICIEYDGIQHYKPVKAFGGQKGFELTKKNDLVKTNFCYDNRLTLIRIPYFSKVSDSLKNFKTK
jgi:very-short-patch-repair endonuclease